jgi:hypothetical protein
VDLKVVRFIREASAKQLVDIALIFIQRYPEVALELMSEAPEPGIDITPNDVPILSKTIFIPEDVLQQLNATYYHGDKIGVIRQIRDVLKIGLAEGSSITEYLISKSILNNRAAPPIPSPQPRF